MPGQEAKSVAEQIIEDLFDRLRKSEAYDEAIVAKLKQIASDGKLTSAKIVVDAISKSEE